MVALHVPTAFEELVKYLAERASPEEVLSFQVSDEAQARAEYLLERNNSGLLTADESVELAQMAYFDGLVSVLKAAALERLNPA